RAQTRRRPPRVAPTTARAHKPVGPPQPRQVVDTGLLVTEPLGELLVGPRIIHSTHRPRRLVHQLTLLHSSRDAEHTFDSRYGPKRADLLPPVRRGRCPDGSDPDR